MPRKQRQAGNCWSFSDLAVDGTNGYIYYLDSSAHDSTLGRVRQDGSNPTTLVDSGLYTPGGIDLDVVNNHIYWTDSGGSSNPTVKRANLDGSDVQTLLERYDGITDNVFGIALDTSGNHMYLGGQHRILRTDLTGGNRVILVSGIYDVVSDVVLDLDAGHIYWGQWDRFGDTDEGIWRADLDGNNLIKVFDSPRPYGLALDGTRIYWTDVDLGSVLSGELDGTDWQVISTGHSWPWGLEITSTASIPEPSTLLLLSLGAAGLFGYGWRRRKRAA